MSESELKSVKLESDSVECIKYCEDSFKSHEALCDITENTLEQILKDDEFLHDIPYDITHEEVLAQIAVVKGQSITVYIKRGDLSKFKIVVPQSNTTVLSLKKAIKRHYELTQRRLANRSTKDKKRSSSFIINLLYDTTKISWRYVWKNNYLEHNGTLLIDDNQLLSTYGVENKSVLKFVKKTKRNVKLKKL